MDVTIADVIKHMRRDSGLTARAAAELLDVHVRTYKRYEEHHNNVRWHTVERIAEAFGYEITVHFKRLQR